MKLLLFYSLRNLLTRKMTTILTTGGMALVVFVFAAMVMLAKGLEKTLVETGTEGNVVVLRRSAESEVQSSIDRRQAAVVETSPEIMLGDQGRRLSSREMVVLITLAKKGTGNPANVVIRGIGEVSAQLRPQVELVAGRWPRTGSTEIIIGSHVAGGFQGAGLGAALSFAGSEWNIVGIFDAGNTGYSSEIWGDADQLMQAFRRETYSSLLFRVRDVRLIPDLKKRLESDPMLTVEVLAEKEYYRKQSEMMATFLRILGFSLTIIFSIGAIVGAMITMYAAVANRIGEIGILRSIGFQRKTILGAFLLESLFLGGIGGAVGLGFASLLSFLTVSTTNFQTFSELSFRFTLSYEIVLQSLAFALCMGLFGGVLPAFRAARMNIVSALREG